MKTQDLLPSPALPINADYRRAKAYWILRYRFAPWFFSRLFYAGIIFFVAFCVGYVFGVQRMVAEVSDHFTCEAKHVS